MDKMVAFVNELLEAKGMTIMPQKILEDMRQDLLSRLQQAINVEIVNNLPPEKSKDFDSVIGAGDGSKIENFLRQNVPDLNSVIDKAMEEFKNIYLG